MSTQPARPRDAGMTLIEVMVAFGVFAIFATGALSVLGAGIRLSGEDDARLTATNLATRELEITRNAFTSLSRGPSTIATNAVRNPNPLPGGTAGQPLVVDGVPFTVVRTAQWSSIDRTATSSCDDTGGAELGYLQVTVEVSWPGLASRPPVAMHTSMTPSGGTLSGLDGHLGVKVTDSSGAPRSGVDVTVAGPMARTAVTGSDGCALLAFLDPGSYTVTLAASGYVDPAGDASASKTVSITASQLTSTALEYDRAARLDVSFVTDTANGYATPSTNDLPVSLGNSSLPSGVRSVAGSTDLRAITNVYPYPSGYQVWAGSCADNDPSYVPPAGTAGRVEPPVATTPGGTASATAVLTPVDVRKGPADTTVVATQGSACTANPSIMLGTTNSNGRLRTSLPYGTWTISSGSESKQISLQPQPAGSPDVYPATPPRAVLS